MNNLETGIRERIEAERMRRLHAQMKAMGKAAAAAGVGFREAAQALAKSLGAMNRASNSRAQGGKSAESSEPSG